MSLNILVADDEASLRDLVPAYLEMTLARSGQALPERKYTLAVSGQDARRILTGSERFDLIILDGQMSNPADEANNGPAVALECVKKLGYRPEQVVVFSGNLGEEAHELSALLADNKVRLFNKPELGPVAQYALEYLASNNPAQ